MLSFAFEADGCKTSLALAPLCLPADELQLRDDVEAV